jgi:CHAD domain-containing protein
MRSPDSAFDLRAALTEGVRAAIAALQEGDGEPDAVHACRVHLKRARALVRVGHAIAPGVSVEFNKAARDIMRSLSAARDLAALAQTAHAISKHSGKRAAAALDSASEALTATRQAVENIDQEAALTGLRSLLTLAQVWPQASARQISRGAQRVVRRARKAYRKGFDVEAPAEKRHQWRQCEKDRLYAMALLDGAWPKSRPRRRKRTKRLVDLLGRERDVVLLSRKLEATPALAGDEASANAALSVLRKRRAKLAQRAGRIASALHRGRA